MCSHVKAQSICIVAYFKTHSAALSFIQNCDCYKDTNLKMNKCYSSASCLLRQKTEFHTSAPSCPKIFDDDVTSLLEQQPLCSPGSGLPVDGLFFPPRVSQCHWTESTPQQEKLLAWIHVFEYFSRNSFHNLALPMSPQRILVPRSPKSSHCQWIIHNSKYIPAYPIRTIGHKSSLEYIIWLSLI